jgi:hypothetical protein
LKITEGFGGPLNDICCCCLAIAVCCATDVKDENKEVGTVLNLFNKCLGTSVLLVYVLLLISFHIFL